jgi:hypothetical protein
MIDCGTSEATNLPRAINRETTIFKQELMKIKQPLRTAMFAGGNTGKLASILRQLLIRPGAQNSPQHSTTF